MFVEAPIIKEDSKGLEESYKFLSYVQTPLNKIISKSGNRGKTGLKNIGNTCYFNSGLQCLSHCVPLTAFFLLDLYKADINENNILGQKGKLAESYREVLEDLWNGVCRAVNPLGLKKCIEKKADQFKGIEQQDAQELIFTLLDGIHEDLNRVKEKAYVENAEYDGRPDEVVSLEQWQKYLLRNQSVIVDLFTGQFKSKVVCPLCKITSVTFDPFMVLSLPIPAMGELSLTFVPESLASGLLKMSFSLTDTSLISDLKKRIAIQLNLPPTSKLHFLQLHQGKVFHQVKDTQTISETRYQTGDLFVYEYSQDILDSHPLELRIQFPISGTIKSLKYPLILPISLDTTVESIKDQIKKKISSFASITIQTLEIVNNRPLAANSLFSKKYINCEFCDKKGHEGNCEFHFESEKSLTYQNLVERMKKKRDLVLVAKLEGDVELMKANCENLKEEKITKGYECRKDITLMDCFEAFVTEEQLDRENMWYCKKCQKDVQAKKKMDIFKLPKILVIHLKRFKQRQLSGHLKQFVVTGKISDFIDYPITGLDITHFLRGHKPEEKYVYDLFSVSNHIGGISGGHYTATCFNPIYKKWMDCDDSHLTTTNRIVTGEGYVLFYALSNSNV